MDKKKIIILLIALLGLITAFIFIIQISDGFLGKARLREGQDKVTEFALEDINFNEVSVHDPSIIKVNDTFYVFGTHIAAAKSADLLNWTHFTNGYTTPDNVLYGDLSANLAESFAWAGENDADSYGGYSVWAPEIFWNNYYVNEDGTTGAFMLVYSASSTYIRSAIGFAVAQNIEGPYQYVDTLVYSGFTEHESYDERSTVNKRWDETNIAALIEQDMINEKNPNWFTNDGEYNNRDYPNAIDANLFFDANERLMMSYGSWSGGIFLLELDKSTGRVVHPGEDGETADGRLIDRYFGTKISGGYYKSGEGPYIHYDPNHNYYYLYVTYGWLEADGAYHMRQFRSDAPDGPYLDAAGQPAVLPGDVSHAAFGNKIMGNFSFARELGEPGFGPGQGYMSPGHNSVYYNAETETSYLVFHTRFPNRGEAHELRIHQLFMNRNGWPVVAPKRFSGEVLSDSFKTVDVLGAYKFINHQKDNDANVKVSQIINLHEDGTISGAIDGTWARDGYYTAITINNLTYEGVFVETWDEAAKQMVMSFTALSDNGVSIWGMQSPSANATPEDIVDRVDKALTIANQDQIVSDLTLATTGFGQTTIVWASSNEAVISTEGIVNRPVDQDVSVTLTATITNDEVSKSKSFTLTVLAEHEVALTAHYSFEGDLGDETGVWADGEVIGERIGLEGGNLSFEAGVSGQAASFNGESGIALPDQLINSSAYTVAFWVNPTTLTTHTPAFFASTSEQNWLSMVPYGHIGETMLWSGSDDWYDAPTGLHIRENQWSHLAFTVEGDTVAVYVDGEQRFTSKGLTNYLTANTGYFALGVNYWDPPYQGLIDELVIFEGALSERAIDTLYQEVDLH
ncbi:arabinan endo-1,5-alpha-L-arabinosidase [Amphibacillus marinus]|uniref:Arabinan endo-1,5-alpha-L-arabinosidase n=1 Tax=Amphibacillus marinus TaxID=872970 RepID=A0A1H8MH30_9BACI|nr:LamG-like jellyroll fold domain-containing protein [Amphibacillus marinus]SEO16613.1 arabinan endo-1,5-alpha-L-arabinosidase [Amphibacillus marinus]